ARRAAPLVAPPRTAVMAACRRRPPRLRPRALRVTGRRRHDLPAPRLRSRLPARETTRPAPPRARLDRGRPRAAPARPGGPARQPDLTRPAPAPGWPLPYRLAYETVPGVAMFRVPWRWVGAARLCCVLAGANGLSALARGRRAIVAWGALLIVASVAEALPHRLLLVPPALPAGYGVVRDDPGAYAILDLPSGVRAGSFGLFSSLYMAYQTGH